LRYYVIGKPSDFLEIRVSRNGDRSLLAADCGAADQVICSNEKLGADDAVDLETLFHAFRKELYLIVRLS
jgi:hypothetical protein